MRPFAKDPATPPAPDRDTHLESYSWSVAPKRKTRPAGQATIDSVKIVARQELEEFGAVEFNLDRVLARSNVSRGSVYHHFGNRSGLIAVVAFDMLAEQLLDDMRATESMIEASTTPEQAFAALTRGFTSYASEHSRRRRELRVAGLAAREGNPELKAAVHKFQTEGTAQLETILNSVAARGLLQLNAPTRGVAYLMQSMLFGRILADIAESDDVDSEWSIAAITALRALLLPR